MPNEITYSRTVKLSKDYNSEATSITLKLEFTGNPEEAYAKARQWVDAKLSEHTKTINVQSSHSPKEIVKKVAEVKAAPKSNEQWNVITEKQIKFLSVAASKNGKGGPTLWNKVKETGKFCSFKDGKNNLTKAEFQELLNWAQE